MAKMAGFIDRLWHDEDGATMLEYALLITLVATACVAAVTALGESLKTPLTTVTTKLSGS